MITVRSEGSRAQGQHAIQLQNGECSSLLEISQTEPNGGHNNNAIKGLEGLNHWIIREKSM